MTPAISIIIPALNEAACIGSQLRQLQVLDPPAHEVIVVDGGSEDTTVEICHDLKAKVLQSGIAARSVQMNQGAATATGEILCFLHADTQVPPDVVQILSTVLADPRTVCGGFISLMTGPERVRWGISFHNFLKTYYGPLLFRPYQFFFKGLRLLFGDQVIFCRKADFIACGGYDPQLPLMEDGDLCKRLGKLGRIRLVNRVVHSSDRRVAQWGAWKATFLYVSICLTWGLGLSPSYWKRFYEHVR